MANRYWVGGAASWNGIAGTKWALTSGGAGGQTEPTAADDVFFDANSGANTVTISGTRVAKSITCTGFTGTLAGTSTPELTLSGNLTLATNMTVTYTGTTTFNATATITSNGKTLGPVTINGSGITVTLGDALNLGNNTLTITQGTFTTSASNYSVTAGALSSSNSNTRTITLNGSTVTLTNSFSTLSLTTTTGLTFNANTSTINCTGFAVVFDGGGLTYYNVSIGDTQNNSHTMSGTNTFNNLTINNRNGNGTNRLSLAANITVNGTFTCNGTQTLVPRRVWIRSNIFGTNRTITAAAINIFGTDFRNITGAGAASWTDSSRTKYWGDAGGNSGITFATGRNAYWNLAGTQSWTANAWALTNNGTPAAANYPLIQDTATFTEAGSAGTVQLDTQGQMIGNLTMADGVSNRTSAMTLNFFGADQDNYFGNITLFSNLTLTGGTKAMRLSGYANTQQITTAGVNLSVVNINTQEGYNNTVQLQDDLLLGSSRTFTLLNQSTFNANNFNVTAGLFVVNNSSLYGITEGTTKTLTMGSGTWTLSGTGTVWNIATTTGLTFNKNTANIVLSDTSTTARTFAGGSLTYNDLTIGGDTGTSTLTITGTNTFNTLASTKTVAHTIVFPNVTTTVTNWTITGTAGNVVTLSRTGGSGTFTLAKTNRIVVSNVDYLSISNSTVSPVNTWYAGANSTNGGGNTDWIFTAAPNNPISLVNVTTAVQNTSSTTITVNVPSETANGDVMILVATTGVSTSSAPWTTPSGWTLWGNNGGRTVFYRIASSEPASYTVAQSVNTTSSACILTYRNAAIDVFGAYSSNSNPSVAPSITTTANNAVVLDYVAGRTNASTTYTTPTNFTSLVADSDATQPSYAVFSRVQATAGATGTATTTPSGGTNGMSVQFAIIPITTTTNSNFFFMMGA